MFDYCMIYSGLMFVFIVSLLSVCTGPVRDQLSKQVQDVFQERQVLTSYRVTEWCDSGIGVS